MLFCYFLYRWHLELDRNKIYWEKSQTFNLIERDKLKFQQDLAINLRSLHSRRDDSCSPKTLRKRRSFTAGSIAFKTIKALLKFKVRILLIFFSNFRCFEILQSAISNALSKVLSRIDKNIELHLFTRIYSSTDSVNCKIWIILISSYLMGTFKKIQKQVNWHKQLQPFNVYIFCLSQKARC